MTEIDKNAVTASRVDSLMDSGAVEAPESHAEGSDVAGAPEGTGVDYRAEYEALKATFEAYRVNTIRVATKYGNQAGGCGVVDRAIAEIDPMMKRVKFGASAVVTLRITVNRIDANEPVSDDHLWGLIGNIAYDLGNSRGKVNRVGGDHGHVEILSPFVRTDKGNDMEVPEFVSPAEFTAREEAARKAKWAEGQERGLFGRCNECDTNLTHQYECANVECDEFINRDADGNRV